MLLFIKKPVSQFKSIPQFKFSKQYFPVVDLFLHIFLPFQYKLSWSHITADQTVTGHTHQRTADVHTKNVATQIATRFIFAEAGATYT